MATSCVTTATLTRTDVSTSTSFTTTTSFSTVTAAPETSTSFISSCVPVTLSDTNSTTCTFETSTSFITIPGNTSILTLPATLPVDFPFTSLVTLFGTSCTTSPSNPPPAVTPPVTDPPVTPPITTPTTTPTTSTTPTPTPSLTPTDQTTPPTPTPTGSTPSGPASPSPTNTLIADTSQHKSSNAGAIAGGVVGGVVAILLLAILTWRLIKKQPRFDDIFNTERPTDNAPHYKKKVPETKPYDYGMIGQQNTNPINITPPSSPPPTQATFGNQAAQGAQHSGSAIGSQGVGGQGAGQGAGYSTSGAQGVGGQAPGQMVGHAAPGGQGIMGPGQAPAPQPPMHLRNPSLTPLLAGVAVAAAAAGGASAAASGSSRPSTAGSMDPLIMHDNSYPPTQNAPGSSSTSMYPPALQNWTAAQLGQSSGYGGGASNTQGYGAGPAMAGPSSLNHTMSAGSSTTAYTSTSWAGGASSSSSAATSTGYNGGLAPIVPTVVGGAGAARNGQQQQQAQVSQTFAQYEDPFARSGSPVSVQEQRILQVTNADPDTPVYPPTGPSRQSYYGGSPPDAGAAAVNVGRASVGTIGAQQRRQSAQVVDGKGRPLDLRGEKTPLVHLDGSLYQEQEHAREDSTPPAYQG